MAALVDVSTGEVVQPCSEERARDLTDKIRTSLGVAWELIKEAYTERAWSALGYESWDDYCTSEFGTGRLRLPREERREVVGSLRDAGLSVRAIEAATGVSRPTVINDLREVVKSSPPDPVPVTGTDGKTYSTRPTSAPPKPQRRALTDSFFDACHDLGKTVDRIIRLTEDDRFARNAEQVATKHRSDLLSARDALDKALQLLP